MTQHKKSNLNLNEQVFKRGFDWGTPDGELGPKWGPFVMARNELPDGGVCCNWQRAAPVSPSKYTAIVVSHMHADTFT